MLSTSDALAAPLAAGGIRYEHCRSSVAVVSRGRIQGARLGGTIRSAAMRTMETEEFRSGIARLATLADARGPAAIMCAEAVWWRCHRALASDYLNASGIEDVHILGVGKVETILLPRREV